MRMVPRECGVLRGTVSGTESPREVSTQYGTRSVSSVTFETGDTVTLWGQWAETATHVRPGQTLGVIEPTQTDEGYATTGNSRVVIEPSILVDVTDLREWVQCPRQHHLSKLQGADLAAPLVVGTIVHDVFEDLLRDRPIDDAVTARVADATLELGLLDRAPESVADTVRDHAEAVTAWLDQQSLTGAPAWRSEQLLLSNRLGLKGRVDALRDSTPVELKTGANTNAEPRFQDKLQVAAYALLLAERGHEIDSGVLLYTKNATLEDTDGETAPAKPFSLTDGLLSYVLQIRNELVAFELQRAIPTGHEADAICEYCYVHDSCRAVAGRLDHESKAGQLGEPLSAPLRGYFEANYQVIEQERLAVKRSYRRLWERSDGESQETLSNLTPVATTPTDDGGVSMKLRRSDQRPTKLSAGDLVLASATAPTDGPVDIARIKSLDRTELTLTLSTELSVTRVDAYPSEVAVDRMLTAVHDAVLTGSETLHAVVTGRADPTFDPVRDEFVANNSAQNEAVRKAVGADPLLLLHGPPGTGKTHTIARIVEALLARDERVLLTAFTNRAVDNALGALRDRGLTDVVRVGSAASVHAEMQDLRLTTTGETDPATTLQETPVVAATAAGCGGQPIRSQAFDVAIIDEASQLTEPETLAVLARADRYILVGDHKQLPPVAQSDATATVETPVTVTADLSQSLFERLIETYPQAQVTLTQQYRMPQRIQAFSSQEFYDGALRPATAAVARRSLADLAGVDTDQLGPELTSRVRFQEVPGDDYQQVDHTEASRIGELTRQYLDAGVDPDAIGVIAPYRAQAALLEEAVHDAVAVDTVDRFQGSSKDVIVISFVASGDLDSPIFEDKRRVNVALTRARRSLILVGDRGALTSDPFYERMVAWADRVSARS